MDAVWEILENVLPAAAPLVFGLVVGLVGFLVARVTARRRLEKLLPALEPGTGRLTGGLIPRLEGIYAGYTFSYRVRPKSNNNPGGAELAAKIAQSSVVWSARRLDSVTKVLLRLGAVEDVEIGDDILDAKLRFSAAEPRELRSIFVPNQAREDLRKLVLTTNFQAIRVKRERVQATWSPRNAELDESPEVLRQRMQAVAELLGVLSVPPGL